MVNPLRLPLTLGNAVDLKGYSRDKEVQRMLNADEITSTSTMVDKKWVAARPVSPNFKRRLSDAIQVILGKADAVKFYKQ